MKLKLPDNSPLMARDFLFGAATASFQIEGGAEEDGRCPSIWDRFCDRAGAIKDGSTGKTACDHYRLWQRDIELIAGLNFDAYRFSLSWPRIVGDTKGTVNQAGLDFYKRIVETLRQRGIKPFVTLYHWDLPQYWADRGGWLNREVAYAFAEYADVVSRTFGNDIEAYATLNEPWCSAFLGYDLGIHAPGYKDRRMAFQASHHLLLAHGLAMPVLKENAPGAKHGIVLNFTPAYPFTSSHADSLAAELSDAETGHWFLQPLMERSYPRTVLHAYRQEAPLILPGDMESIGVPIDYLGVNYYTRSIVSAEPAGPKPYYKTAPPAEAKKTAMGWDIYPDALTRLLKQLHAIYRLPPIYITENGAAFEDVPVEGRIEDGERIAYFQDHLDAVHRTMESGVDIRGYFAWSLLDNFEWAEGYTKRFGLVYVDYESQKRVVKESGKAFQKLLASRLS